MRKDGAALRNLLLVVGTIIGVLILSALLVRYFV